MLFLHFGHKFEAHAGHRITHVHTSNGTTTKCCVLFWMGIGVACCASSPFLIWTIGINQTAPLNCRYVIKINKYSLERSQQQQVGQQLIAYNTRNNERYQLSTHISCIFIMHLLIQNSAPATAAALNADKCVYIYSFHISAVCVCNVRSRRLQLKYANWSALTLTLRQNGFSISIVRCRRRCVYCSRKKKSERWR